MKTEKILGIVFAMLLMLPLAPLTFGATYVGPTFTASPAAATPGTTIDMLLSTSSGSTFVAPPSGSGLCNPADPSTCTFLLQSCPSGNFLYYQVFQTVVTDPSGNQYMLGSATTSGLANPQLVPPRTTSSGAAPAINVTIGDSGVLPFGTGAGGFFALTSLLSNPPNNVNPEGPYYWWTVAGHNSYGPNLRVDQNPQITPTSQSGTYNWDLEGQVYCVGHTGPSGTPTSTLFFDARLLFIVTPGIGGPTRTIGFWQTHLAFLNSTWNAYFAANPGGASICGLTITTAAQAMGGLWASIPKTTTGDKRSNVGDGIGQVEMILVQQWIGALLNVQAFGTSDGGLLAAGQAACASDNPTLINNAAGALDLFNGSGDNIAASGTGSATPQAAKAFADKAFWDTV